MSTFLTPAEATRSADDIIPCPPKASARAKGGWLKKSLQKLSCARNPGICNVSRESDGERRRGETERAMARNVLALMAMDATGRLTVSEIERRVCGSHDVYIKILVSTLTRLMSRTHQSCSKDKQCLLDFKLRLIQPPSCLEELCCSPDSVTFLAPQVLWSLPQRPPHH